MTPSDSRATASAGMAYGMLAYGAWGVVPLFWKELAHISIWEIGAQRIIWGSVTFMVILGLRGRGRELGPALKDFRLLGRLALSATLLATNWLVFIYAVSTDRVLHASLGYFINPFVSVALGAMFLGERLTRARWAAVTLAGAGVVVLATRTGGLPWVSLVLAGSFGLYGLIRKTVAIAALPGSTVETILLLPLGIGYAAHLQATGSSAFAVGTTDTVLLASTGLVTALPLLWFANAARRLQLATIGFLQYLAPTGQFILAVTIFGEPLHDAQLVSFGLIWAGLAVFSADAWLRSHL